MWAVGVTMAFLLLALLAQSRSNGELLHTILIIFGLYALIPIPWLAAGVIAEERSSGSLGILFLSGLTAVDIFVGKVFGVILITLNDLLVIFPLLAVPFMMGGVSYELFVATVICLPLMLVFLVSAALLASALSKDEAAATNLMWLLIAMICGTAPAIWTGQRWFGSPVGEPLWLASSPAYPVYLLFTKFSGASVHAFWVGTLATVVWSLVMLLTAGFSLRRLWQRGENRAFGECSFPSKAGRLRTVTDRVLNCLCAPCTGKETPLLWLELRNKRPAKLALLVILVVAGLWCIGWFVWPDKWPCVGNFYVTSTVLLIGVGTVQRYATARRFAVGRLEGEFELLFSTNTTPQAIVASHLEARRRGYRRAVAILLTLECGMAIWGLCLRDWTPGALVTYSIVWVALGFWAWNLSGARYGVIPVAWAALISGRTNLAAAGQGYFPMIFWLYYILRHGVFSGLNSFPTGSTTEVVITVFLGVIGCIIAIATLGEGRSSYDRLVANFKSILSDPIPDPNDPRYAKWKKPGTEPFPWDAKV